jgi:uncharacterized repeat protein (TIGR02543 family)
MGEEMTTNVVKRSIGIFIIAVMIATVWLPYEVAADSSGSAGAVPVAATAAVVPAVLTAVPAVPAISAVPATSAVPAAAVATGASKVTVLLNVNGGKAIAKDSVSVRRGKKIGKLPVPKRSRYEFMGWYSKKHGGTLYTGGKTKVTTKKATMTLYARWAPKQYFQSDKRWGNIKYGKGHNVRSFGCGPTAMAMAMYPVTKAKITPKETAKWSTKHNLYTAAAGRTKASFFTSYPKSLGVKSASVYNGDITKLPAKKKAKYYNQALEAVKNGNWVIFMVGGGDYWRTRGHYILWYDVDGGYALCRDPNGKKAAKARPKLTHIREEAHRYWIIDVPEEKAVSPSDKKILSVIFTANEGEQVTEGALLPGDEISILAKKKELINVKTHSQKQIKAYLKKSGATVSTGVKYSSKPLINGSVYKPGKLTAASLKSGLKMVNQIRYIAGIDYNVSLNSSYTEKAQAASIVIAATGVFGHFPPRPTGMNDQLYQQGASGAGSSNLSMGASTDETESRLTLANTILNQYMADDDNSNIAALGHRRWVLNPVMKQTGFGYVSNIGPMSESWEASFYSSMYVFDQKRKSAYRGISWPAKNMPVEYFESDYPWSISMGFTIPKDKISVTLKRKSDNKTWKFSSKSSAGGYFNVNNDNYGLPGCIIFRPDNITYDAGDQFEVTIKGIPNAGSVKYNVNFFAGL